MFISKSAKCCLPFLKALKGSNTSNGGRSSSRLLTVWNLTSRILHGEDGIRNGHGGKKASLLFPELQYHSTHFFPAPRHVREQRSLHHDFQMAGAASRTHHKLHILQHNQIPSLGGLDTFVRRIGQPTTKVIRNLACDRAYCENTGWGFGRIGGTFRLQVKICNQARLWGMHKQHS